MDLWIRSQDKTVLTKANSLWVSDNQIWMEVPFYENHKKIGLTVAGHNHRLAFYKSKDRALEVLDDIQDVMLNEVKCENHLTDINYKCCNGIILYQMPKE